MKCRFDDVECPLGYQPTDHYLCVACSNIRLSKDTDRVLAENRKEFRSRLIADLLSECGNEKKAKEFFDAIMRLEKEW